MNLETLEITDDMGSLLSVLPKDISLKLTAMENISSLLEVVLDLGRPSECRFSDRSSIISPQKISVKDIKYVVDRIGEFGDDNRAGIEHTLHRISAIRNRKSEIIGLTCRVGRAVYGTMKIIEDLIRSGQSILLLGRPGVGKTTMLREVARFLADEVNKRVVIVDTSNEIAGDGDIPHIAIGGARRMHVATPSLQHGVMIEAVENHMPEVIIIDEIGTELETTAARTIAERGVQLIGTAHGNTLENLMLNPTLSDLIGGIQTVTLGDDEARRRKTRKSVLERKSIPTFPIVVEIQNWYQVSIHQNVGKIVDIILRGQNYFPERRWLGLNGVFESSSAGEKEMGSNQKEIDLDKQITKNRYGKVTRILPFGINRSKIIQLIDANQIPIDLVDDLDRAELVVTTKQFFREMPQLLKKAEDLGKSILVLKRNSTTYIREFLEDLNGDDNHKNSVDDAIQEVSLAAEQIRSGEDKVILNPQTSYLRKLQHQVAEDLRLASFSVGKDPRRRVTIARK
jgi:stage III sporulation protein SpoIIIAA